LTASRFLWRQTWRDLAFLHWPVSAALLRPSIPTSLEIEEHDGTAWLGIIPFLISGGGLANLPGIRLRVPELNLRTYVRGRGEAGVWFFSLDTTSPLAVWGGRNIYRLAYRRARMAMTVHHDRIEYRSSRLDGITFHASYAPRGNVSPAAPGTLEHFLVERYRLFAESKGRLLSAEIRHRPWPLQPARVSIERNDLPGTVGVPDLGTPACVHFARHLEVDIALPRRVA
jgi:uncharacterized protein YqjF (DUF2071 family)